WRSWPCTKVVTRGYRPAFLLDHWWEVLLLRQPVCSHRWLPWLPAQRPGVRRECEPGRDQRMGRAGHEPARLGCFSLTGIDAVPPRKIKAPQREVPRPWPGHTLSRIALQFVRRRR